jgi:hypothetical protein
MSWKAPGPTPLVLVIPIAHPIPTILDETVDEDWAQKLKRKAAQYEAMDHGWCDHHDIRIIQ